MKLISLEELLLRLFKSSKTPQKTFLKKKFREEREKEEIMITIKDNRGPEDKERKGNLDNLNNVGNLENQENKDSLENKDNAENLESKDNLGKIENQDNAENQESKDNPENKENLENVEMLLEDKTKKEDHKLTGQKLLVLIQERKDSTSSLRYIFKD